MIEKASKAVETAFFVFQPINLTQVLTTLFIAFIGFWFAFKQIDKQFLNQKTTKNEDEKQKKKIEVFNKLQMDLMRINNTVGDARSFAFSKEYPKKSSDAEYRMIQYYDLMNTLGPALVEIVFICEANQIVNVKLFKVFNIAISAVNHDLRALRLEDDYYLLMLEIVRLCDEAQSYIGDVLVCLQNMAYGTVFDEKVEDRVPLDKRIKVIIDEPNSLDELFIYFNENSNWGLEMARINAEIVKRFKKSNDELDDGV